MIPRLVILFILYSVFCISAIGKPSDDKSVNRPILAAERKQVEKLINKAAYHATIKSDSCIVYAQEAAHLAKAYNSPGLQAEALDVTAGYYYDLEKYQEVRKSLKPVFNLYTQLGDSLHKAQAYKLYGLACYNMGIYDEAIKSYHNATRMAIDIGDNALLSRCYQNIGVLYAKLNRPKQALDYYEKALDLYSSLKDKSGEASIMQNLGIIYNESNKYREALGYYLSALKVYQEIMDTIGITEMYLNLGSLSEDQIDLSKSLEYYRKALTFSTKVGYKYGIAYSYYSMGTVYKTSGNYDKALESLQKSMTYSKMIDLAENESDCHKELSGVYHALGDFKSAYEELREYEILHDSLYSERVQEGVAEVEMRFKTEMKDREIEDLRRERQKAIRDMIRRTIGLISIITLTVIIVAVSMYYSRTLKKANNMLTQEIDERFRAEKELISIKENLEERVVRRTRELEIAKLKAEESDRLKSSFIANMSHEIRTPLNAITGFSGLLLREEISAEKKKEYNDYIVKNNKILVNLIEDLIDTSKIESGNLQLHPSNINIRQFLYQMNEPIIENMARKNKAFIDVVLDENNLQFDSLVADPVRLQQVMWHILDNAVKFTREGCIHYGCKENNQFSVFYIDDTGIGILEEHKDVVFEKFRQLDESAKRKFGGTGLGLYYARKIAEMMGGKLWFESKKVGGSIFYFSVPRNA
jgi:signal transduction histidine kinase